MTDLQRHPPQRTKLNACGPILAPKMGQKSTHFWAKNRDICRVIEIENFNFATNFLSAKRTKIAGIPIVPLFQNFWKILKKWGYVWPSRHQIFKISILKIWSEPVAPKFSKNWKFLKIKIFKIENFENFAKNLAAIVSKFLQNLQIFNLQNFSKIDQKWVIFDPFLVWAWLKCPDHQWISDQRPEIPQKWSFLTNFWEKFLKNSPDHRPVHFCEKWNFSQNRPFLPRPCINFWSKMPKMTIFGYFWHLTKNGQKFAQA